MAARPPLHARPTAATRMSASSFDFSTSTSDHGQSEPSTLLTTPDLCVGSPTGNFGKLSVAPHPAVVYEHRDLSDPSHPFSGARLAASLPSPSLSQSQETDPLCHAETRRSPTAKQGAESSTPKATVGGNNTMARGPSVKERASQFEQRAQSPVPVSHGRSPSSRPLPVPLPGPRTASGSPVHSRLPSSLSITPSKLISRIPVPPSAHTYGQTASSYDRATSPSARSPAAELNRSRGSTRQMVAAWEGGLPTTPTRRHEGVGLGTPPSLNHSASRTFSKEYLDGKPLPLPRATPVSSPAYASSSRAGYAPSPLTQGLLQTPPTNRRRANTLSPSASTYSLSPSPNGKKKGRSPLKDKWNAGVGALKDLGRKVQGKGKEREELSVRYNSGHGYVRNSVYGRSEESWNSTPSGLDSSGVYTTLTDRMGDAEMSHRPYYQADEVIRGGAVVFLTSTPCSTDSPYGTWLTAFAALTASDIRITFCPVFPPAHDGKSTPRRVLSGASVVETVPGIPYSQIPPPKPGTPPDSILALEDFFEARPASKNEMKSRGIPLPPDGVDTNVLELVWSNGTKVFVGAEGMVGRVAWRQAIEDVARGLRADLLPHIPPASPMPSPLPPLSSITPRAIATPAESTGVSSLHRRVTALEQLTSSSISSGAQKVDDEWLAPDVPAASEVGVKADAPSISQETEDDLRNSLTEAFAANGLGDAVDLTAGPTRRESATEERIRAWQPQTERDLSIFKRSSITADYEPSYIRQRSGTELSFDPNDLNPSRSASQVRRYPASKDAASSRAAAHLRMPALDERESEDGHHTQVKATTHISHITFPKAFIDNEQVFPGSAGAKTEAPSTVLEDMAYEPFTLLALPEPLVGGPRRLSTILSETEAAEPAKLSPAVSIRSAHKSGGSSAHESSVHTGRSGTPVTALTAPSSVSGHTMADPRVFEKLDGHTTEHGMLSKQMDTVGVDVKQIMSRLKSLPLQDDGPLPKILDDKLTTIGVDVKAIESALALSNLAARGSMLGKEEADKVTDVHTKLDKIASLCEDLLVRHGSAVSAEAAGALPVVGGAVVLPDGSTKSTKAVPTASVRAKSPSSLMVKDPAEEKAAGEEVAQIMANITGGSSKSPRRGSLMVLHKSPGPGEGAEGEAAQDKADEGAPKAVSSEVQKQVEEVLEVVKELKDARNLQQEQTSAIAKYLNDLNGWLEKFVTANNAEIATMSKRLGTLCGPDEPPKEGETPAPGLPDLIAQVHEMAVEQKKRNEQEGLLSHRIDAVLTMMAEDRERQAKNANLVEQVAHMFEQQRADIGTLLAALGKDISGEINGERLRFVDMMDNATRINIDQQMGRFKELFANEYHELLGEVNGLISKKMEAQMWLANYHMQDAVKTQQITVNPKMARKGAKAPAPTGSPAPAAPPGPAPAPSPQPGGRVLPQAPGNAPAPH